MLRIDELEPPTLSSTTIPRLGGRAGGKKLKMTITVLNAHTGNTHTTDLDLCTSFDELRAWITRKSSVQTSHQILLTDKGKPVKFHTLSSESTLYLYDRAILATSASASKLLASTEDPFEQYHAPAAPQSGIEDGSLDDLLGVSNKRRDWAQEVLTGASRMAKEIQRNESKQAIVKRGTEIAVGNMQEHLASLGPKYEETKQWADQVLKDQQNVVAQWKPSFERMRTISIDARFPRCLKEGELALKRAHKRGRSDKMTLQDFVDGGDLEEIGRTAANYAKTFNSTIRDVASFYATIQHDSQKAINNHHHQMDLSHSDYADQADRLLEEIEVLSRKIGNDTQYMGGFEDEPRPRMQAAKMVQLHGDNFVPSIVQTVDDIGEIGRQVVTQEHQLIQNSTRVLQNVSVIESQISSVHSALAKLNVDPQSEEIFNLLDMVTRLPAQYGVTLVEYVRRTEWAQRLRAEAFSSDHHITQSKVTESKRRAQWSKSMDGIMTFNGLGDLGITDAINLSEVLATREDIDRYVEMVTLTDAFSEAVQEIREAAAALQQHPKRHATFETAFKHGSIHEASYGRDSVSTPRQNSNVQGLNREKAKLDEKLKSAESRIRKLEDLLHRQSQVPRPPSANGISLTHAPSFERQSTAPATNFTSALSKARDVGSRRSSTSSRRVSQNLDAEEKSLAQRIVGLEAELINQRELTKELKRDAKARANVEESLKAQAKEAIATKEDLLGNMESQQHEFDNERRVLKDENTGLGIRLEELEDEFDRILTNNENDNRVGILQEEVEKLRSHARDLEEARNDDLKAYQRSMNDLRNAGKQWQHQRVELEATVADLQRSIRDQKDVQARDRKALRSTFAYLSPGVDAPEKGDMLADRLEEVAKISVKQHGQISSMLDQLRADNVSLESRLSAQSSEVQHLRSEMTNAESKNNTLDEQILAKTTESSSLQTQLDTTLEEKEILQSMFKSSESEVEALKRRLEAAQVDHEDLQTRFGSLQGFHGDLDDQVRERNDQLNSLQQQHQETVKQNSAQADRAEHISKQLQLQIEGLKKVLEVIGLMMARQGDTLAVQKIPKNPVATGTALADFANSMRRSVSGPLPTKSELEGLIDTEALGWATAGSAESATARYSTFMKSIADFDIEAFNEGIIKRIKEVEHIARKWQREAKAYREKARNAQNEAHERIALRAFKEGDLALFLPTRDQATKPWAAFNVGAPHYFLREQDSHKLAKRDWLIARVSRVEERVVDLSKSMNGLTVPGDHNAITNDNPYELSDGLRWYLVDAAEEKPGAPISIGTGKATVAVTTGAEPINVSKPQQSDKNEASKTLARSLESRRSSTNSRKSWVVNQASAPAGLESMLKRTDSSTSKQSGERASLEARDQDRVEPSRMQEIQPTEVANERQDSSNLPQMQRRKSQSPSKQERARSPNKGGSPSKRRGQWDSLLSLDYNLEGGS